MREQDRLVIAEFRASEGKPGILLLHDIGRKTAQHYVHPLTYGVEGNDWIIIAGNSGLPTNPGWYFNLKANPETSIEVGAETIPVTAVEILGAERDATWIRLCESRADLEGFQRGIDHLIPLFRLTRR